jgi:hypothetical protein
MYKGRVHLLFPWPDRPTQMRNLDITDTRAKLITYAQSGLLTLSIGSEMPHLTSGGDKE